MKEIARVQLEKIRALNVVYVYYAGRKIRSDFNTVDETVNHLKKANILTEIVEPEIEILPI